MVQMSVFFDCTLYNFRLYRVQFSFLLIFRSDYFSVRADRTLIIWPDAEALFLNFSKSFQNLFHRVRGAGGLIPSRIGRFVSVLRRVSAGSGWSLACYLQTITETP